MNPTPGLTDQSVNMTRPRRRRLNFVPQPGDRLPITTTTTPQREERTTASARAGRSTAPMVFDPEIATPNWEVYRDPSTESLEATVAQPDTTEPLTSNTIPATASASPQAAPSGQQATDNPDSDTSSFNSDPSTRPQHQIGYENDEASRIMIDRIQRTVDSIFSEERRRQRRFLRQQRRQAQNGNGTDAQVEFVRPTNAEMVARLQARYAELTLLEGHGNHRSDGELEAEQGPEQQPELEQSVDLELPVEESSHEQAQEQGQDLSIVPEEMTGVEEIQMPQQDYHDMPMETQQVTQQPGQRTSGHYIGTPTSLILDPLSTPASAYISQAMPTPQIGLSFAERARARGMNFDISSDIDMEEEVDLYPQARKRARRIAPNPADDDRVYQAEMHPEDASTRLALLSERMQAVTATAATLGDTLVAATALATDLNAGVSMPVPTVQDPDPDQEIDAEPTAEDSLVARDSEVRKSKREGRKQERNMKKLVNREARGLQRI